MAKAIVHSTYVSKGDYNDRKQRGHVSVEIKATELKQRDDEWRGKMWGDEDTGEKLRKALIRDVIKLLKTLYPDSRVKFSQKAGCNCGCSPGFYVETPAGNSIIPNGTTVFVELVD